MVTVPDSASMTRYKTYSIARPETISNASGGGGGREEREQDEEPHHRQRTLARSRPATNPNLLPTLDVEINPLEHKVQVVSVSRANPLELERARLRPIVARLGRFNLKGRFRLELNILLHALDGDNVGLDFGGGSDCVGAGQLGNHAEEGGATTLTEPVERLRARQRVAEHKSHDTRVDIVGANEGEDGQPRRGEDDEGSEELESYRQPTIAVDAREEGLLVPIDARLILGDKAIRLTVGANGRDATECLLERGKDGRLGRGVQPLEFARGGEVVAVQCGRVLSAPSSRNELGKARATHVCTFL